MLLAAGDERPLLVDLAALDLESFFSIDASELFDEIVKQSDDAAMSDAEALRIALATAGRLHLVGRLSVGEVLSMGQRLALFNDYGSDPPELMRLYGLDDEWGAGWGRGQDIIAAEVRELASSLNEAVPDARSADIDFLAAALS